MECSPLRKDGRGPNLTVGEIRRNQISISSSFNVTNVEAKPWFCEMSAPLQNALAGHLGQLLTEVQGAFRSNSENFQVFSATVRCPGQPGARGERAGLWHARTWRREEEQSIFTPLCVAA